MKPGIIFRSLLVTFLFSFVMFLSSCSDSNLGPASTNTEISYMSTNQGLVDGGLQIDSAKILVKDFRFGIDGDSITTTNFRVATFALYLDMTGNVKLLSDAYMALGTYTRASLEVHQSTSSEAPDPDFFDANGGYSIVVMGSYNGSPFKFKSQLDVRDYLLMQTPVTITADVITNITLRVSPYKWFISGGGYLDPTLSANTSLINANIQSNVGGGFNMYKDSNKDGNPD